MEKKPDIKGVQNQSEDVELRRIKKTLIIGTSLLTVIFIAAFIIIGKWFDIPLWWILIWIVFLIPLFVFGARLGLRASIEMRKGKH